MAEQVKDTQSDPLPPLENIYFLTIAIKSAKDLPKMDTFGQSDPFIKVIANKQSYTTKVIEKNLNPVWEDENTSFVFFDRVGTVRFEVYDWDKGSFNKSDEIGSVELQCGEFYENGNDGFDGDLVLQGKEAAGSIQVKVEGRLIKPLELEQRCDALNQQCQQQSEDIASKNEAIQALATKNTELMSSKQQSLDEQQRLNGELAQLRDRIAEQRGKNEDKRTEMQTLREKTTDLKKKNSQKEQEIGDKEQQVKDEQSKLATEEAENERLQTELAQHREQLNQDN
eukprot:CAMPEP_0202694534 /NCGR_PEP_ID=MMETSP1385-20130828/8371_1 /ASSEMBLY_ACC=CAM_ASM_000861 /TAXON_ID=933848 /ORGANISM="Elphidium margaritaceum" /LENGTH=282 /DNA_ID=CAMNT_0049350399 /DNA_START=38 /DNA_END=886 /DNA_ORIENTATION=+